MKLKIVGWAVRKGGRVRQASAEHVLIFFYRGERTQIRGALLLDTSLSSTLISNDSTRHSVTSRIHRNSRLLSDLIFSTRHLNATLEKRHHVEKFNTCPSLLIRREKSWNRPKRVSSGIHSQYFREPEVHVTI